MVYFIFRTITKQLLYSKNLLAIPSATRNFYNNKSNNNIKNKHYLVFPPVRRNLHINTYNNNNMANKIGILITEDGGKWKGEAGIGRFFTERFTKINNTFQYEVFRGVSGVVPQPAQFSNYIGFVISGSHHSVNDNYDWIDNCRTFIRQLDDYNKTTEQPVRLFDICYGHQLIASAFGGIVRPIAPDSEGSTFIFGAENVEFTPQITEKPWFANIFEDKKEIMVMQSHGEEVSVLPSNAVNVGKSILCQNEALVYGDNILSFQGHPEMEIEPLENIIGKNLLKTERVKKAYFEHGMENARKVPTDKLTTMIMAFLSH